MKKEESVLVAVALFLLAGVILYNVLALPSKQESGAVFHSDISSSEESISETVFESETAGSTVITETSAETSKSETDKKININTASAEELMTISGIGEVKAQAIIAYRNEFGPFPTVGALTNVTGIGEKTLLKIKDKLTV